MSPQFYSVAGSDNHNTMSAHQFGRVPVLDQSTVEPVVQILCTVATIGRPIRRWKQPLIAPSKARPCLNH